MTIIRRSRAMLRNVFQRRAIAMSTSTNNSDQTTRWARISSEPAGSRVASRAGRIPSRDRPQRRGTHRCGSRSRSERTPVRTPAWQPFKVVRISARSGRSVRSASARDGRSTCDRATRRTARRTSPARGQAGATLAVRGCPHDVAAVLLADLELARRRCLAGHHRESSQPLPFHLGGHLRGARLAGGGALHRRTNGVIRRAVAVENRACIFSRFVRSGSARIAITSGRSWKTTSSSSPPTVTSQVRCSRVALSERSNRSSRGKPARSAICAIVVRP